MGVKEKKHMQPESNNLHLTTLRVSNIHRCKLHRPGLLDQNGQNHTWPKITKPWLFQAPINIDLDGVKKTELESNNT